MAVKKIKKTSWFGAFIHIYISMHLEQLKRIQISKLGMRYHLSIDCT